MGGRCLESYSTGCRAVPAIAGIFRFYCLPADFGVKSGAMDRIAPGMSISGKLTILIVIIFLCILLIQYMHNDVREDRLRGEVLRLIQDATRQTHLKVLEYFGHDQSDTDASSDPEVLTGPDGVIVRVHENVSSQEVVTQVNEFGAVLRYYVRGSEARTVEKYRFRTADGNFVIDLERPPDRHGEMPLVSVYSSLNLKPIYAKLPLKYIRVLERGLQRQVIAALRVWAPEIEPGRDFQYSAMPTGVRPDEFQFRVDTASFNQAGRFYHFLGTFIFLLLALLGTLLVFYITRKELNPITKISEAFQKVGEGDLSPHLVAAGSGEVGALAHGFNLMVEKLKEIRALEIELHKRETAAAVGQLAAGVAHDVKNPLNTIGLTLSHLSEKIGRDEDVDRPRVKKLLENIRDEVRRLNNLVNNFLSYARNENLAKKRGDINETLLELTDLFESEAAAKKVVFETELDPDLPAIMFDGETIKSALSNVLVNALQFAPDGSAVRIETQKLGNGIAIRISDRGPGIGAENLEAIFQPYFTTRDTGTGLGLAITNKIVNAHGGQISVDSRPGDGTCFTIRLPFE